MGGLCYGERIMTPTRAQQWNHVLRAPAGRADRVVSGLA